jgi:NAD-dependent deacetylase sirtuin 5
MDLATPEAFDEILVWCGNFIIIGGNYESFFSSFRHNHTLRKEALMLHSAAKAQPNAAHKTIALLSSNKEVLKKVAPNAEPFKLITQNVDNLSIRPLGPSPEASALPIEMHGNLYRIKCTSESPDHVETNTDSPIVPALGGTELIFDRGEMDKSLKPEDLPRCSKCGELARPAVVWFGESIDLLPEIDVYINRCDLLLVVGTSSTVRFPFSPCPFEPRC